MARYSKPVSIGNGTFARGIIRNPRTGTYRVKMERRTTVSKVVVKGEATSSSVARTSAGARRDRFSKPIGPHGDVNQLSVIEEMKAHNAHAAGVSRADDALYVEMFADSVLRALRGLLHSRFGALAAAEIDLRSLGAPDDVAEWLASALPSSHPFDEATGPFYDADGVARRLRTTSADVLRRAESNTLLACPTAEGTPVFPVCQFNADGSTVSGLSDVLAAMQGGTADRWQVALWMNTPVDALNDQTPAQALRAGDAKAVRKLAEHTAARWRR